MIPGPIEFDQSVLEAMAMPSYGHTSKEFIQTFSEDLEMVVEIFDAKNSSPFLISGSGTLGMEISTVNFINRNSKVLVVSNGYFGDRFVELLSRFTKNVEVYKPPLGQAADPLEIYERVNTNKYDLATITHVDTSSGVRNDLKQIAKYFKGLDTVLVADGVCSIGGEEFSMEWGIDVAFTASQKALGTPPGLAIGVVGSKALSAIQRNPPMSYFSDLRKWLEVFKNTIDLKTGYFGTPNVNLLSALNVSLKSILKEGLKNRYERHEIIAKAFRNAINSVGLRMVPEGSYANTLSVPYLPDGVKKDLFLTDAERYGAIFAGGLLPDIKDKYFRIGHMGSVNSSEVMISVGAIERSLLRNGYEIELGTAVSAAEEVLFEHNY